VNGLTETDPDVHEVGTRRNEPVLTEHAIDRTAAGSAELTEPALRFAIRTSDIAHDRGRWLMYCVPLRIICDDGPVVVCELDLAN
jgi:hypothetical protein